jgi:outer membrane protein OmpA-like peptidoglycan-associated protein
VGSIPGVAEKKVGGVSSAVVAEKQLPKKYDQPTKDEVPGDHSSSGETTDEDGQQRKVVDDGKGTEEPIVNTPEGVAVLSCDKSALSRIDLAFPPMSPKMAGQKNYEQDPPENLKDVLHQLEAIVSFLAKCPNTKLAISGHSCSSNSDGNSCWSPKQDTQLSKTFGYKISTSRAAWVANWFLKASAKKKIPTWAACPTHYRVSPTGASRAISRCPTSDRNGKCTCDVIDSIKGEGGDTPVTSPAIGKTQGKIDQKRSRRVEIEIIAEGGSSHSGGPSTDTLSVDNTGRTAETLDEAAVRAKAEPAGTTCQSTTRVVGQPVSTEVDLVKLYKGCLSIAQKGHHPLFVLYQRGRSSHCVVCKSHRLIPTSIKGGLVFKTEDLGQKPGAETGADSSGSGGGGGDGGGDGGDVLSAEIKKAAEAKGKTCVTKTPYGNKKQNDLASKLANEKDLMALYKGCLKAAGRSKMFVIYPDDANEARSNCWLCSSVAVRSSRMNKAFLFKVSTAPPAKAAPATGGFFSRVKGWFNFAEKPSTGTGAKLRSSASKMRAAKFLHETASKNRFRETSSCVVGGWSTWGRCVHKRSVRVRSVEGAKGCDRPLESRACNHLDRQPPFEVGLSVYTNKTVHFIRDGPRDGDSATIGTNSAAVVTAPAESCVVSWVRVEASITASSTATATATATAAAMTTATAEGAKSLARAYSHFGITNAAPADSHLPGGALPGGATSAAIMYTHHSDRRYMSDWSGATAAEQPIIGVAGGDFGLLAAALAASEDEFAHTLSQDEVAWVFRRRLGELRDRGEKFSLSTTPGALKQWAAAANVQAPLRPTSNVEKVRLLLALSDDADRFIGCPHVQYMLQSSAAYGCRREMVTALAMAYFDIYLVSEGSAGGALRDVLALAVLPDVRPITDGVVHVHSAASAAVMAAAMAEVTSSAVVTGSANLPPCDPLDVLVRPTVLDSSGRGATRFMVHHVDAEALAGGANAASLVRWFKSYGPPTAKKVVVGRLAHLEDRIARLVKRQREETVRQMGAAAVRSRGGETKKAGEGAPEFAQFDVYVSLRTVR